MVQTVRSVDGTAIAYEQTGRGQPLILVGGALNNRQSAAPLATLLAPHFSVVTFDRRGRGESTDTPPYAVEREVQDLTALVDAVGGSAHMYGHSSGAILGLETAAAGVAIGKLAIYEPPYLTDNGSGEGWQVFADRLQSLVDEGHPDQAVEAFIRHTGADFDPAMKQSPWWPALLQLAPSLPYDITVTGDSQVPVDLLEHVTAPLLALYGTASPPWAEASTGAVAVAVRNGRQEAIADQDHGVAPEALAPLLIEFFR
jgi:pimeloyl-ACP methyl ester carboxylesterase